MNKIKMIVSIILVLLVGTLAGSLGTRMYLRSETERPRHNDSKVKKIMTRLTKDLRLSSTQQVEIEKILTITDAKAANLKALYEPDVKKLYEQSFALIKEKLDDGQKSKLQLRQDRFSRRYNAYYFRSLHTAQNTLPDIAAMKDRLGLDAAQEPEVSKILEEQRAARERTIAKYERMDHPDLNAVRSELAEAEKTTSKRLSAVLTGQQMKRYLKAR